MPRTILIYTDVLNCLTFSQSCGLHSAGKEGREGRRRRGVGASVGEKEAAGEAAGEAGQRRAERGERGERGAMRAGSGARRGERVKGQGGAKGVARARAVGLALHKRNGRPGHIDLPALSLAADAQDAAAAAANREGQATSEHRFADLDNPKVKADPHLKAARKCNHCHGWLVVILIPLDITLTLALTVTLYLDPDRLFLPPHLLLLPTPLPKTEPGRPSAPWRVSSEKRKRYRRSTDGHWAAK